MIGRRTLEADAPPPWGWTDAERTEPALFMTTTVTDPGHLDVKPGTLIAWWAVDRAARVEAWARDCTFTGLAKYYQSQEYGTHSRGSGRPPPDPDVVSLRNR